MSASLDYTELPLRAVLRPAPLITPADSLSLFLKTLRLHALTELPVQEGGRLCGVVSQEEMLPLLESGAQIERSLALQRPVADLMRPAAAIARPEMTPEEVGRLCAERGMSAIPVADSDGYLLGVVVAADLLLPDDIPLPRPAAIGGMATPFGVYLTNGSVQAGVGNGALVATGFLMGLLLVFSHELVRLALWWGHQRGYYAMPPVSDLDFELTVRNPTPQAIAVSLGLKALLLIVFFLLLRATRLAGYHAAEHQTVHAIERNEPLSAEVVRRMPRAHPRCGTNFMAAGLVFVTLLEVFRYIPVLNSGAEIFAAVATMFTWRTFGTFLQERFTTRPASEREIASGIAAGNSLLYQYLHSAPERPRLWKRIWCMGLPQTIAGTILAIGAVKLVTYCWEFGRF